MLYNLSKTFTEYNFTEPSIICCAYKSININDTLLKITTTSLHCKNNYFIIRCFNKYKFPVYFIRIHNRNDYKNFLLILNAYQRHVYTQDLILSQTHF